MGYDLLGGLLFAALTPLVILSFIAFWLMTNRERAFIEQAWESFAASREREFVPARGEWPNRTSPLVRWSRDDVAFVLSVVGLEGGARTRLAARPRGRLLGGFAVRAGARADDELAIGDALFSQTFAVRERPAGLAERVLDAEAQRALLSFRQRDDVTLRYRRGAIVLEWPGREANDARLEEAERVVASLVAKIDAAFRGAVRRAA